MNRKDDTNENPEPGSDRSFEALMEAKRPRLQMARIEAWGRFPCWTMAAKAFVLALVVLTHLATARPGRRPGGGGPRDRPGGTGHGGRHREGPGIRR